MSESPLGLYYNFWFKPTTDTEPLDERYMNVVRKFQIISAMSEESVYKICHRFYELGMGKNDIKTIDGLAIESYIDPGANHKYNLIQFKNMTESGVLSDVAGRWVVIPQMTNAWTAKLVYLLFNTLREEGALGLVFYSVGDDNFGKVLVESTVLDVLQFPGAPKYERKRKMSKDNY